MDSIKKGIRDADSEARVEARKYGWLHWTVNDPYFLSLDSCRNINLFLRTYWGLRSHFPTEAESLYNSLESTYQKTLQSCLKSSGSVASLPQSDRSSSSSQESLKYVAQLTLNSSTPSLFIIGKRFVLSDQLFFLNLFLVGR